jgi:secreted Zn-dependent insulinase-like peptidase
VVGNWAWLEFGSAGATFHLGWEKDGNEYVESSDVESDGGDFTNQNSIKHLNCYEMWKEEHFIYDPKPQVFVEVSQPNIVRNHFLTLIQLFYLFWLLDILQDIVNETNRYIAI